MDYGDTFALVGFSSKKVFLDALLLRVCSYRVHDKHVLFYYDWYSL